jgi:hypothetical protein
LLSFKCRGFYCNGGFTGDDEIGVGGMENVSTVVGTTVTHQQSYQIIKPFNTIFLMFLGKTNLQPYLVFKNLEK